MLMLVIDDGKDLNNKETYLECLEKLGLPKDSFILTAYSLSDALRLLKKYKSEDCSIVINFVLIEQILKNTDELKEFAKNFPGIIILKVKIEDETLALNLLKENIITEYFVETGVEDKDKQRLTEVFKIAINKRKFNVASRKFEEAIQKLDNAIDILKGSGVG